MPFKSLNCKNNLTRKNKLSFKPKANYSRQNCAKKKRLIKLTKSQKKLPVIRK